ncbi:MAG: prepilin peptidase, partial [Clostridiales bacterium]|nr:prepilin peptidase [Clostridiales bacterium]
VCICRIPNKEDIVSERSHCMHCGNSLEWYDMFPIFSFILLKGKCRNCGQRISIQYPIIEALNGLLYILVFWIHGFQLISVIYCLLTSALLVLSIIDFQTYEIPSGINLFIGSLGIIQLVLAFPNVMEYLLGLISVSGFLLLIYLLSKGRGIGGGDIKLMAAGGLILGFPAIVLAFILGCILGSIIHLIRMRISQQDRVLAFGPYLSAGMLLTMLFGDQIISWYLGLIM